MNPGNKQTPKRARVTPLEQEDEWVGTFKNVRGEFYSMSHDISYKMYTKLNQISTTLNSSSVYLKDMGLLDIYIEVLKVKGMILGDLLFCLPQDSPDIDNMGVPNHPPPLEQVFSVQNVEVKPPKEAAPEQIDLTWDDDVHNFHKDVPDLIDLTIDDIC